MTITLQVLSLVEKAEPVQVCFALCLRDQHSIISECKVNVKSTWIPTWHRMDHVSWSLGLFSKNHLLEAGLSTKPRDHGTPNAHNCWFNLFYHV